MLIQIPQDVESLVYNIDNKQYNLNCYERIFIVAIVAIVAIAIAIAITTANRYTTI